MLVVGGAVGSVLSGTCLALATAPLVKGLGQSSMQGPDFASGREGAAGATPWGMWSVEVGAGFRLALALGEAGRTVEWQSLAQK